MARPRSDIHPRIIYAAREAFLRDGVDGASLRKIAKAAGTNIGMIYYYFPTKDDLFLGVVEDTYKGVLDDLVVALAEDVGVEERIERLYLRIANVSDVEVDVLRIVIREALSSSTRITRLIERISRGHMPLVHRTVRDGVESRAFRGDVPIPAIMAAVAALGTLPQLARRLFEENAPHLAARLPPPRELASLMGDLLVNGIGAKARN